MDRTDRERDEGFLDDAEWDAMQRTVPIVCVDMLLYAWTESEVGETSRRLLLIERDVPDGPDEWKLGLSLVGGRVRYGELLGDAVERHLHETLSGFDGSSIPVDPRAPTAVAEFFPEQRNDVAFDSRRHAVALSYLVELPDEMPFGPRGEAHRCLWISEHDLARSDVGFRQWMVIEKMLGHELRP